MSRRLQLLFVLAAAAVVVVVALPPLTHVLPARVSGWLVTLRDAVTPDPPDPVPPAGAEVLFVGDSLVARMPGLGSANMGVNGDTVSDVRDRLPAIVRADPESIVLLVGTNDLLRGADPGDIAAEYERLLSDAPPRIDLTILSVPPMKHGEQRRIPEPETITALNRLLAEAAATREAGFVDLAPPLREDDGNLRAELTEDGIHLNEQGYAAVEGLLAPLLRLAAR